jgi:hypothetical protein
MIPSSVCRRPDKSEEASAGQRRSPSTLVYANVIRRDRNGTYSKRQDFKGKARVEIDPIVLLEMAA